jgi:hypothetical protein
VKGLQKWVVSVNENKHEIVLEGVKMSGKATIGIDGVRNEYMPVLIKKAMLYPLDIDGSEIILKLDLNNRPLGIIQDGKYVGTDIPAEHEIISSYRAAMQDSAPLIQRNKIQMRSFQTFVVFTYLNPILLLLHSPFIFPFSAIVPQVIVEFGLYNYLDVYPAPNIFLYIVIALVIASVYLLLYILAMKRTWPIVVTLIFVAIDTASVLFFAVADFSHFIIDIVFHGWVLWSLIKLIITRRKKVRMDPAKDLITSA